MSGEKWNLSKPNISEEEVVENLNLLKIKWPKLSSVWLNKDVIYKCIYLQKIAQQNYELGGDIKVECEDLLEPMYAHYEDEKISSKSFYGSLAHYVFANKSLKKAVRNMARDCIMFKEYADDIRGTAF